MTESTFLLSELEL